MPQQPYTPGSTAGLPAAATGRLQSVKDKKPLFTSDLSVNEFLLVRDCGFEPLGLVMGCSIYHTGIQWTSVFQNKELDVLTQALYHARELAMTRMEEEADLLGADGIVGVRLEVNRHAFGSHAAEFMAIGTAIRHQSGANFRTKSNRPFTSGLSGQDFWTLLHAGYRPVSLVMGNCVYRVGFQGLRQQVSQLGRNVELPNFTQALYSARESALFRMQAEARAEEAQGVVSADVHESNYGWGNHVIEFFAIGTAIVPTSQDHHIPKPTMTLSLNDPVRRVHVYR
jgi:uncharacterized protein YbjQ (UPF0145 family)